MGAAQKYIPHYTYDDWLHWEGKWELIEGVPIAMSPMPVPEHQRVAAELTTELSMSLKESRCKSCRVYQPLDYKISDDTIFEPDVLVVCGKITKNYLDFPPALIVEILSKSTEERDRGIKYQYYQQEKVKYYLIVDIRQKKIETYELIDGQYQLQVADRWAFKLDEVCSISPDFNSVWD